MKFVKMHGAGNDFVLLNNMENKYLDYSKMALLLCNRRFGIGADGILIVEKSEIADVKMIYFNSDGSRGEMCGNGIRCFSKFVYEEKIVPHKEVIKIETDAGIKEAYLTIKDNEVTEIKILMGNAVLNPKLIPVDMKKREILKENLNISGEEIEFSAILLGVPHAIIFTDELEKIDVNKLGKSIEIHPIFPKKINVNFVEIVSPNKIKIKTWERGAGRTLACGTGSCSAVFIANLLKMVKNSVFVETEGGVLKVDIENDKVFMSGNAVITFRGECDLWE